MQPDIPATSAEDWELVSESSDSEGGLAEEAALAASFLLGEPSAAPTGHLEGGADDAAAVEAAEQAHSALYASPGSPEHAQLLQLTAAPAGGDSPATYRHPCGGAGGASFASLQLPPALGAAPLGTFFDADAERELAADPHNRLAALPPPDSPSPPAERALAARSSSSDLTGGPLTLRVVRSDKLTDLEKRAGQRDQELALARLRLSSAQAALAQESRELHRFRRIAMVACSVCAFLGLKALLGGPMMRVGAAAVGAGAGASLAPLPRECGAPAAVAAHSVREPTCAAAAAEALGLCGGRRCSPAELDCPQVSVLVEPLGPASM